MIVNCYLLNISVSRRSRRYVVHKAIIIVQQVKLKLLFVWFPVLKAQPVDVPVPSRPNCPSQQVMT